MGSFMKKGCTFILVVYSVTFGLLLPWFCINLGFSMYYRKPSSPYKKLDERNAAGAELARIALESLNIDTTSRNIPSVRDRSEFCVIIVSVRRNGDHHYLLQVTARLLHQIAKDKERSKLVVLNADENPLVNEDAIFLSRFTTVLNRTSFSNEKGDTPKDMREKEKQDYVGALKIGLQCNADYLLIVEDDAMPAWDLFDKIRLVLRHKFPWSWLKSDVSDWAYLKLYYPEKWQGYSWTEAPELVLIGILGGITAATLQRKIKRISRVWFIFIAWFMYFVLFAYSVGRAHLIELRKLSPMLYSVFKAPRCCTPAVLFQRQYAQKLADFLSSLNCSSRYPLDLAMDDFTHHYKFRKYIVTPNLFTHIGVHSSLNTALKDYREFDLIFDP